MFRSQNLAQPQLVLQYSYVVLNMPGSGLDIVLETTFLVVWLVVGWVGSYLDQQKTRLSSIEIELS